MSTKQTSQDAPTDHSLRRAPSRLAGLACLTLTRKPRLPYAVCLLTLLAALASARAATEVSGDIFGQTWTKTNSPYVVVGDIRVASLTIEPGVQVTFSGPYVFGVAGTLQAIGKADDPIAFDRDTGLWPGSWAGIYFNDSYLDCELAYCSVSNSAKSGIRVVDCAPLIRDCTIGHNSSTEGGGGIRILNGTPVIRGCMITQNTAPEGGGMWADVAAGDLVLRDCVMADNASDRDGGGMWMRGSLRMADCRLARNTANPGSAQQHTYGGGLYLSGTAILERCILSTPCHKYDDVFSCIIRSLCVTSRSLT